MADILPFKKPASPGTGKKAGKNTGKSKPQGLCQHGFHKWEICKDKQFDVKQGKLVTVYRCARCGAQKVKTH
jgi:hypothetical protein